MVQKSLVSYINEMLKRGYGINSVRAELVRCGYPKEIIEEAVSCITPASPEVKHIIHFSKSTLIGIAILSLGLIIVALSLVITSTTTTKKLLDLKVDIVTDSVEQGSFLEFSIYLSNFGAKKRYDVTLNYNIVDQANKAVAFKTETAAVETKSSLKSSIRVPKGIAAGDYILKVTANYDSDIASASDSFSVAKKEKKAAETEQEVVNCDDSNKCTKDFLREGSCAHEDIIPCCGNNICETGESYASCQKDCVKEELEEKEKPEEEPLTTDLEKITKEHSYCADIKVEARDDCYGIVAEKLLKSEICKNIISDSKRDVCYTNFVTNGDYSVCEELTLKYLKDSCKQLRMIEGLKNK